MTIEEFNKAKYIDKKLSAIEKALQVLLIPYPIICDRTNTNEIGFESFDKETCEGLKTVIKDYLICRKETFKKEFKEL